MSYALSAFLRGSLGKNPLRLQWLQKQCVAYVGQRYATTAMKSLPAKNPMGWPFAAKAAFTCLELLIGFVPISEIRSASPTTRIVVFFVTPHSTTAPAVCARSAANRLTIESAPVKTSVCPTRGPSSPERISLPDAEPDIPVVVLATH